MSVIPPAPEIAPGLTHVEKQQEEEPDKTAILNTLVNELQKNRKISDLNQFF